MLLLGAVALGLIDPKSINNKNVNFSGALKCVAAAALMVGTVATLTTAAAAAPNMDAINGEATVIGVARPPMSEVTDGSDGNRRGRGNGGPGGPGAGAHIRSPPLAQHTTSAMIVGGGGGGGIGSVGHAASSSASSSSSSPSSSSSSGPSVTWDSNITLRSISGGLGGPSDWFFEQCLLWQRPHHLYYQLGNAFFFLAFLAPHRPFGILWLRSLLAIGCIMLGMYGYLIGCFPDVLLWSGLFLGVNLIYMTVAICRLRPVRFEKEIESVYAALFKPLHVSRREFKKVLNCMKNIRSLKYQEVYAQEKVTKVDSLSLVLSGKLVVSQNQRALHIVFAHQFLDSPEWFGVSTDDYFQVSIMAMEESRVLIWHRDKLKLSIMAEPFLQTVFDHILGRDVVKKLMQVTQVSESIASNGFIPSGGGGGGGSSGNGGIGTGVGSIISGGYGGGDDSEDKQPMLVMKKSAEGHGLTALINRQLQALPRISKYYEYDCAGDPNAWRLGRIDETDHETAV